MTKKVAKKWLRNCNQIATCAMFSNFCLSNLAKKWAQPLNFFCNLGEKMSSNNMSVAEVKVAQHRYVCDQSDRKLQAMLYTYPLQLLVR